MRVKRSRTRVLGCERIGRSVVGVVLCLFMLLVTPLFASPSIVIGIAGASGSGKTTLARNLKRHLGNDVEIIGQDSYYKGISCLSTDKGKSLNFDIPSSIEFELLHAHLVDLKAGKTIKQPIYDFTTHSRTDETTSINPKKIFIVEGSLILAIPEIRDMCDIKLFIDVDIDICLCRRIERDQVERGRQFHEIRDQYLHTVRPMFFKYVAPSKLYADLIVPNLEEGNSDEILEFISAKLSHMIHASIPHE